MSDIERVVSAAGRRLFFMRLATAMVITLASAIGVVGILRLVQKVALLDLNWWLIAGGLAGAVMLCSLVWASLGRLGKVALAQRVDDGAGLKDSLSTALVVSNSSDPWAKNVVTNALSQARTVDVRKALPWQAPRHQWSPLIAALVVAVLWFIPMPDMLGKKAKANQQQQEQAKVDEAAKEAKQAETRVMEPLKKLSPEIAKELAADNKPQDEPTKPKSPDEYKRDTIKQLTSLSQKIEQLQGGKEGQKAQITQDMLRQLRAPAKGAMSAMAKEMAKGNFRAAQEELQKSMEDLASGNMSAEDKQQMKEQLENLASQLQKLAESKKELENKLQASGMDPKLAADPEKLAEAMKNNEGLSEQQKEAMVTAAEACKSAGESMSAMSQALSQMAQGMSQQGMSQQGSQAAQQMQSQMQAMQQMMQDSKALQAALSECKLQMQQAGNSMQPGQCNGMGACENGMQGGGGGQNQNAGTGQWKQGNTDQKGSGQGGPGIGDGGGRGEEQAEEVWTQRKAKTQLGDGPIIASTFIEGDSIKNESKLKFSEAVAAARKEAQDAVENNSIDKPFQKVVKHYYNALQSKAGDGGKPSEAKPADKPAEKPASK